LAVGALRRMAVLAIVAVVGCRPSSEQESGATGEAPLSCSRIAEHVAAIFIAGSDKSGVSPEKLGQVFLSVVTRRCSQDHWSEDAKTCALALTSADKTSPCEAKLTGEQFTKLSADLDAEARAAMPPSTKPDSGQEREASEVAAARAQAEFAQAEAAQARADAEHAREAAQAERAALLKREAPSHVLVAATGCRCAPGQTIVVSCQVLNDAQVPVEVSLAAASETGTLGHGARGTTTQPLRLAPGKDVTQEVTTYFSAGWDCSSCANSECTASVTVR